MSDKTSVWRDHERLSPRRIQEIDEFYVLQLRSMFAVEDMIAAVIAALETQNRLDNTYLFFTADNGFHHGEHRIPNDKQTPFEEVIRAPLMVTGPGIPASLETDALASVIDLAPTMAELAGAPTPDFVDGRSLVPSFTGGSAPGWRDAVIAELDEGPGAQFVALRMERYSFVSYSSGPVELYDLELDPYQLENVAPTAEPDLINDLQARLDALATCGIEGPITCQAADGGA